MSILRKRVAPSLYAVALVLSIAPVLAAPPRPDPALDAAVGRAQGERPRIGLVLGGGGAKGAAHVGVLSALDELGIPVDCVVGTSMGALVGGTFAAGMGASDVEQAVLEISWESTLGLLGQRPRQPMRRKLAGVTFSNNLEFGLEARRITAPTGFIGTQNIEQTIQQLVSRSRGTADFDDLPIPFRAIATDMQSGEMVVLESGSLAQAMRASMAVPGVFSPVTIGGRILGDGGLSRNLPVDVARETCADVVIAVSVPNRVPTAEELQSPLNMVARTIEVLIGANEKQQLGTLGPADVAIVVRTGDIGPASFDRVRDVIPLGRAATLERREELLRYALPAPEYRAWRESVARAEPGPARLAAVELTGLERVDPGYARDRLGLEAGAVVTERQISDRVAGLYAMSDFETVRYALRGEIDESTLEVELRERAAAPNILRFDLGFYAGTDETTAFTIGGDYLRPWVNRRGGELHGALRLGRTSGLDASLYQPLDRGHRWFVEPGLTLRRSVEDFFADGDALARYTLSHALGYLAAGRTFGTHAELRAGVRAGTQSAERDIAFPGLGEISGERAGGVQLRYTYDSRDLAALARSGLIAKLVYFHSTESLGAAEAYDRLEATATYALPVAADVVYLRASGGTSLDTTLPVYDTFTLGGPVSFPGLSIGELRGMSYWSGQVSYLHKVVDISNVFGQALYAGFALTAAEMNDRIDAVRAEPIYSGAFIMGGRTPLGPLSMSLAATTTGEWRLVFGLGRPVEERTITDPVW